MANATGSDAAGVRGAIAQAARATGMDFSYLLGQARLESGLNPSARAVTSSAKGLYQFTDATWVQTLARHGGALGVNAQSLADPAARAQLMGLRNDPQASALMAAAMAGDNQAVLTGALGRAPTSGELYLAHFLGADGAVKFLSGLASDPSQSAASLFPKPASTNRAVFFDATGAPRSLAQVMGVLNARLASAMQDGVGQDGGAQDGWLSGLEVPLAGAAPGNLGLPVWSRPEAATGVISAGSAPPPTLSPNALSPIAVPGGPIAREFAAVAGGNGAASSGWHGSMADTLRITFGADAPASAGATTPGFIRSAYGRLQALGL